MLLVLVRRSPIFKFWFKLRRVRQRYITHYNIEIRKKITTLLSPIMPEGLVQIGTIALAAYNFFIWNSMSCHFFHYKMPSSKICGMKYQQTKVLHWGF